MSAYRLYASAWCAPSKNCLLFSLNQSTEPTVLDLVVDLIDHVVPFMATQVFRPATWSLSFRRLKKEPVAAPVVPLEGKRNRSSHIGPYGQFRLGIERSPFFPKERSATSGFPGEAAESVSQLLFGGTRLQKHFYRKRSSSIGRTSSFALPSPAG